MKGLQFAFSSIVVFLSAQAIFIAQQSKSVEQPNQTQKSTPRQAPSQPTGNNTSRHSETGPKRLPTPSKPQFGRISSANPDWIGAATEADLDLVRMSLVLGRDADGIAALIKTNPNIYFFVNAGTKVQILDVGKRNAHVRLPNGKQGWLPKPAIVPSSQP